MNETVSVQHRGEKRPRNHALYNTSNGSVFYFNKNKATNERQKRYVTTEWWKEKQFKNNSNTSKNNHTSLTNKDMNLLRTYYAFGYNASLSNDIIRGYKKDKSRFPTMQAFETNLRGGGGPKKRARPSWMRPAAAATTTTKKPNNNFLWYNVNGQYINRNEEESQLY
jgi:hypothetical protein